MNKKDVIDIIAFYPKIGNEIKFYENMKSKIEEEYDSCGASPREVRVDGELSVYEFAKGSGKSDPTAQKGERMAESGDGDHIREIEAEIERLQTLRSAIFNAFKILPYYQKQVVWYYYIDGKRWAWVARKVGYSDTQCRNIRDKAVVTLGGIFEKLNIALLV
jgi:hypothetical protein